MKINLGSADRIIRLILALAIGIFILSGALTGATAWVLGILAIVLAITSALKFCPIYGALRISSSKKTEAMQH